MDKKEQNAKTNAPKKTLIRTRRESNKVKIIATIIVLLVAVVTYYFIDSGSYVATVDGNRISRPEYQFFLSRQKAETENKEELSGATPEEINKFWTTPADGQDPWEEAKRKALDLSKEYMIQRIKAQEMGLKVNSAIKGEIQSLMTQYRGKMTEGQFSNTIKNAYKITLKEFQSIYENMSLIDQFKNSYLSKNYTKPEFKDEDLKAGYEKDTKKFDKVDIRYISLSKLDKDAKELPKDQLDAKKKLAEEALGKIKQGEDIDKIIAQYTEDKGTETGSKDIGKLTVNYQQNPYVQPLIDWVFENKPGDAEIVDTQYYIYVAKIEKRTGFEDVKADVKTAMEYEAKEKFYDDALQTWTLEPRFNILTNDRVYNSISYK